MTYSALLDPEIIRNIHKGYFDAGSDMVETNTFSATTLQWRTIILRKSFTI